MCLYYYIIKWEYYQYLYTVICVKGKIFTYRRAGITAGSSTYYRLLFIDVFKQTVEIVIDLLVYLLTLFRESVLIY